MNVKIASTETTRLSIRLYSYKSTASYLFAMCSCADFRIFHSKKQGRKCAERRSMWEWDIYPKPPSSSVSPFPASSPRPFSSVLPRNARSLEAKGISTQFTSCFTSMRKCNREQSFLDRWAVQEIRVLIHQFLKDFFIKTQEYFTSGLCMLANPWCPRTWTKPKRTFSHMS